MLFFIVVVVEVLVMFIDVHEIAYNDIFEPPGLNMKQALCLLQLFFFWGNGIGEISREVESA